MYVNSVYTLHRKQYLYNLIIDKIDSIQLVKNKALELVLTYK